MKSRITLLTFVYLLVGSLAYAAPAVSAGTPVAPAMTPVETPSCDGGGSVAALAIFAPAPTKSQTDADYCGMCGKDPCRGVLRGTVCGYDFVNQRQKRCEETTGQLCPGENRVICYCYSGDIP